VPTSDLKTCLATRFVGSRHYAAEFSMQIPKSCTDLDPTLMYISILGTYGKFVWKNKMLALGVCLPQLCPSACSRFAPSRSRLNHYRTIDSFPRKRTWWNALWTGFFWIRTLDSNRTHPYLNKRFVQEIETPSPTGSEKKYFLSQKVFFSCMWSKSTQKVLFFLYVIQKYFYSPKMVVWYEDNINL